jgi:NAD(P)-dependent dehydrogenase (short-subunit alcohol dehydrogenase family)
VLDVNLTGTMLTCRRLVPDMVARGGGVIVNLCSSAGMRGGRAGAAYTASKWGVAGLTQNIAAMHGADGIRCNAISPGAMNTGIVGPGDQLSPRGLATVGRDSASPPGVDPSRMASVVAFLAEDAGSWVNGAIIPVDGGWLAF